MLPKDADYFLELQTQTGWGKTLHGFAEWCDPQPNWQTLDVGCGPGLLPAIFSRLGCRAVGVDIDPQMFQPTPLHPAIVVADGSNLPFNLHAFDLVTATNLLFLLPQPSVVLIEVKRFLRPGGRLAMLNPSPFLNVRAAIAFAQERGLQGMARDTLINWARRAEVNHRWTETETQALYANAGMKYTAGVLKIGPGFGFFSCGIA
jgi:ubiquinone/menaquinone biosynthesis C-methylase UbiE